MDRLKQLESFVAIAARGSLTAAAKAEGVAPAIIGRRIDALEERLGVKLLLRTAQSKLSPAMSTSRSLRLSEIVTSGCNWWKRGTSGATWRRPKPAGAMSVSYTHLTLPTKA